MNVSQDYHFDSLPRSRTDRSLLNRICRTLVLRRLKFLDLAIEISDPWRNFRVGQGEPIAQIEIIDPSFYRVALQSGALGIARSWINHGWETSDLTNLLRVFVRNQNIGDKFNRGTSWLSAKLAFQRHQRRENTISGSRKNIHDHYDLGNNFFSLLLDKTMTYSSGFFETEESTLEDASLAKLDQISNMLDLNSTDHVLDLGCGWGSFAIRAATRYGCRVTGITISPEQYQLASERVKNADLVDRVDINLCDYRDIEGQYDKLVSIEMIEAVGHVHLPRFFSQCSSLLKPGGKMALQAITISDERYEQYLNASDFIQEYVFPGGCLLSEDTVKKHVSANTDLSIVNSRAIGKHYAETLRRWRNNFRINNDEIRSLGYSEEFLRIWHYYLCYCEAGFQENYLDDLQILLSKPSLGQHHK